MELRSKRFVEQGVLAQALEDTDEQNSLKKFLFFDFLPSPVENFARDLSLRILQEQNLQSPEIATTIAKNIKSLELETTVHEQILKVLKEQNLQTPELASLIGKNIQSSEVEKFVREQIEEVLREQNLHSKGFPNLVAKNRVDIELINQYMEKMFEPTRPKKKN